MPTDTVVSDSHYGRVRHLLHMVCRATAVNVRARLEYRTDFVLDILFGILWQSSTLAFASILLTRFSSLGGFPSQGVLLIVGMRLMSHGLYVLAFDNITFLARLVNDGRLDGYLLRPMPLLVQVLISEFRVSAVGDFTVGLTVGGVAVTVSSVHWTVPAVLFGVAAVIGGMFVEAAVQLTLSCLLLRTPATWVLGNWVDRIMGTFGNYPLSVFPPLLRGLFTFVLPLAFIAYLPVLVLLGRTPSNSIDRWLAYGSPVVGIVLFLAAARLWSWSLRYYRSVGG